MLKLLTINRKAMDYSKIDNVKIEGVDMRDYPDFCDAFISSADYNGEEMNDEQLEKINEDGCFVHEKIMQQLF